MFLGGMYSGMYKEIVGCRKQNLTNVGMNVIHPVANTKDKIAQICFYTFLSQFVSLFYAKKFNQKQCYFVIAKNLRNASSKMIY